MTHVAIIYHSGYGHTKVVAELVKQGADIDGVTSHIFTAEEATNNLDALDKMDALIFGSPTYMGSASADMKSFMDATSTKWQTAEWKDKLAAGFTNSGSLSGDKLSTLVQFSILAAQHQMIWVSAGLPPAGTEEGHGASADEVNRLGSYLGLMTQSDHTDPEHTPAPGDKKSAELFGKRVAEAALRWKK